MMRPALPAKSIAEIAEVEAWLRISVPAETRILRFKLFAAVVRFLSSNVPAPFLVRMPAFCMPKWVGPARLVTLSNVLLIVRVLAATSMVLGALTVIPWSVAPLPPARVTRNVPPLSRMFVAPAVDWPRGPAVAALLTAATSRVPLLMMMEPLVVLLPARISFPVLLPS